MKYRVSQPGSAPMRAALVPGVSDSPDRRQDRVLKGGAAPALFCACVLLAGCSSTGSSRAEREFQPRPYVGAGLLVSRLEPDTDNVAGTSVDENMSGGGSLTLGYDLTHRFSVEGHAAALGEASLDPRGSIDYTVAGLSGVAYLSRDERLRARREQLSVYGRLGFGVLDNDASGVRLNQINDVHLLAGLGVEYGWDNGLGLRAELVAHETDAKYAQLGLIYRFGPSGRGEAATAPTAPVQAETQVDDIPIVGPLAEQLSPDEEPTSSPSESVEEGQQAAETAVAAVEPRPAEIPTPSDSDGDGVADANDQCAETVAGAPVRTDGCAIFDGVVEGINFLPGSDRLTTEATGVLAEVAQTLKDFPDVRVVIEAHTDNEGSAASNLVLSKRRAIAVARYLVDAGISGSRLKPQAYGESQPRTSNRTAQGRAANRRVEFSILQ